MKRCFWLEDQVDQWSEVLPIVYAEGIELKVFEHPDEMREAVLEFVDDDLYFLIDLIISGGSSFQDWSGERKPSGGSIGTGATEVGFNVIQQLICSEDSPVKESPIAILTQRSDDGSMSETISEILAASGRTADIELFAKIDLTAPHALSQWLRSSEK